MDSQTGSSSDDETEILPSTTDNSSKLPPFWKIAYSDDDIYYYHAVTKETSWDPPQWTDEDLNMVAVAKLKSVEQQLQSEKEKNQLKDQKLAKKSGEIEKLRQTAQSLSTQLGLKTDEMLLIKSLVKSALEEELNCPICLQPMTEAVAIKCGHTFCKKCIEGWFNGAMATSTGKPTCPYCRSEFRHYQYAPLLAIQQLQAKLLSCVNGEQPTATRPNGENLSNNGTQ